VTSITVRDAGDAAVLVEWPATIEASINARAVAVAGAIRQARIAGVRDVAATFRSVAVHVDPLRVDRAELTTAIDRALSAPALVVHGDTLEVPVVYGGRDGPDLDAVAQWAGLSADAVIARHADTAYRVFMLGFLPGFAYLGLVDEQIAAPRLSVPRVHVPAGAVGVAGRQTGVYPQASPGGWQLLGRTAMPIFDWRRTTPALLKQGDTVRFVPVRAHSEWPDAERLPVDSAAFAAARGGPAESPRLVTVLQGGPHLSIQDLGRHGHLVDGVPVSGAMDQVSHRVANAMVGNEPDAATVEVTLGGPALRVEAAAVVGLAGADLGVTIDDQLVKPGTPIACRAGTVVRFGGRVVGARAYVAFDGGIDTPRVLGSRSTHARSGLGGLDGRALRAGDRLPLGSQEAAPRAGTWRGGHARPRFGTPIRIPFGGARVRVLRGPQDDWFAPNAMDVLEATRFTISSASDRMGYRLTGGHVLPRRDTAEMISDATFVGALQVPASGDPILLLADRPVTGGYPQLATVITADLPLIAQLAPGDWIEFQECSRPDAVAALVAQDKGLRP
jgi:antagonist of KipI